MSSIRLAVFGSTRGTSLQPIIDAITAGTLNATIPLVVSNKPDAYILERAKQHHIPTIYLSQEGKTREQFDAEVTTACEENEIQLILLIGYMRLLSKPFVERWRNQIMNVHPSLLPAFAGGMDLAVHQAVLDAGVAETGCTIHFVDEGADTGPILVQKKCAVAPDDTAETLKVKVQALEGIAFIEAIQQFQHDHHMV